MISYNHYASGAVGDFFYRRIAGIEQTQPAYKCFRIAPVPGGNITWAKAHVDTPYGRIVSDWTMDDGRFKITVSVPVGTACMLQLPNGQEEELGSGDNTYEVSM